MRFILSVIIALVSIPFAGQAQVQARAANPVHWQFSVKKMDNDVFRFEAKATLDNGYHIWALDAGGDGTLVATSFIAEEMQNGGWIADWTESKAAKAEKNEFFGGAIRWHEKEITFYRDFKGKRGDKVKGAVQYQSCNDQMCFPPAVENFVVLVN
jgi:hypothetical protein